MKLRYYKTEIKKTLRDSMTGLMIFAPIIVSIVFLCITKYLAPILYDKVGFDLMLYKEYILSFVLLIGASILAMVLGFVILDDRDSNILVLVAVTPVGERGYMRMRFSLIIFMITVSTLISYFIMGIYIIPFHTMVVILIILNMFALIIGLLIAKIAKNKVQGLVYAKGLTILFIFGFFRLFDIKILQYIGACFPSYWITELLFEPNNIWAMIFGCIVGTIWLVVINYLFKKRVNV